MFNEHVEHAFFSNSTWRRRKLRSVFFTILKQEINNWATVLSDLPYLACLRASIRDAIVKPLIASWLIPNANRSDFVFCIWFCVSDSTDTLLAGHKWTFPIFIHKKQLTSQNETRSCRFIQRGHKRLALSLQNAKQNTTRIEWDFRYPALCSLSTSTRSQPRDDTWQTGRTYYKWNTAHQHMRFRLTWSNYPNLVPCYAWWLTSSRKERARISNGS